MRLLPVHSHSLLTTLPVAHIAIRKLIRLALLPELAGRLDGSFRSVLAEILVRHDFAAHELLFEIRVDDTGGGGGEDTLLDGPCADFLRTTLDVSEYSSKAHSVAEATL
jgi:hypothetical protein